MEPNSVCPTHSCQLFTQWGNAQLWLFQCSMPWPTKSFHPHSECQCQCHDCLLPHLANWPSHQSINIFWSIIAIHCLIDEASCASQECLQLLLGWYKVVALQIYTVAPGVRDGVTLDNGQQGYTQLHHNDLESLAYTIIYSALSNLPWSSNSAGNHKKAILQKKTSIMVEKLCKGLPTPFCKFITYVHSLGFDQKPDYQYLHSILLQCLEAETNQPIKAPPLYLCQVSVDHEPISTGRA